MIFVCVCVCFFLCSLDEAESTSFSVEPGDLIVLATDGLFDNVSTEQILKELSQLEVGIYYTWLINLLINHACKYYWLIWGKVCEFLFLQLFIHVFTPWKHSTEKRILILNSHFLFFLSGSQHREHTKCHWFTSTFSKDSFIWS